MAGGREFDRQRLKELILFIAGESEDDHRFGTTKLCSILYYADFKAFIALGRSITGATYQRLDRGPVPQEIHSVIQEMESEGEIERFERKYYNYTLKVVRPLRASEAETLLEPDELAIVRLVLRDLAVLEASQVGALSHLHHAWRISYDREVIPYEAGYFSTRRPSQAEYKMWREDVDERRRQRAG